ncbi:MAG: hypothetical protein JKY54_01855 [Flavobacteriales bacterium]|nr:hypothetical protein [Flavobacteriales bacterium]
MKNEPLFDLIKSLSQTEKTYFRKWAKSFSSKPSNYLELFDAIESQKRYDETKLKETVGNRYFAQYKKHLNTKLLESLRLYHSANSIEAEINAYIQNFEILKGKGLIYAAQKALSKAKKSAIKHQRLADQIKIGKYEGTLIKETDNLDQLNQHFLAYQSSAAEIHTEILKQIDLEQLHVAMVKWNKSLEWVRTDEELIELDAIVQGSSQFNQIQETRVAEIQRQYVIGLRHYFLGDFIKSYSSFNKQFQLFLADSSLRLDQFNFIRCIANNALLSIFTTNHQFATHFNRLKSAQISDPSAVHYQSILIVLLQLMQHCKDKQYKLACSWMEINSDEIGQFNKRVVGQNIMYNEFTLMSFYMVNAYLGNGQPKLALKAINNYLNNAQKTLKQDSFVLARIINLLVHVELNNLDLLDYELDATYKYLKSKKRIHPFEEASIKFVRNVINRSSSKEFGVYLDQYHNDLSKVRTMKYEQVVFEFFDFLGWIDRVREKA